ncbi:MAG: alpha/beta fold hydrolase [Deltaproteobacteria bacterium]|nr:MAG: alpha/beta fold hydrolase [Deltaproteobacteria bacterium]
MRPVAFKSAAARREVLAGYAQTLADWPVPYEALQVPTRHGETFVLVSGPPDAPPVVLLHGAQTNAVSWALDIATWSTTHRVFAVDTIGEAGRSADVRPPLAGDAHACWLDDVLDGLGLDRAPFVGISLGGWMTLDYAIRRPERVAAMALLCPGGVGPQRPSFPFKVLPLMLLGPWGQRKARELVLGTATPVPTTPEEIRLGLFLLLVIKSARPRFVKLPIFSDAALSALTLPTLVFLGGRDVLFDSPATRRRFEAHMPHADVRWLPDVGHYITGQTEPIHTFLTRAAPR